MKKFLYFIIGVVVLYLILALVGKSHAKVEREITINRSADAVKGKLGDLKFFHDQWSPWTEKDSAMTTNYKGDPGTIGHKMDWDSKVRAVGQGTLEIVGVTNDSLIQKLSFKGMGDSKSYFVVTGDDNTSKVTWGMEMKFPFLLRPMMMFMNAETMIGPDYEKGLSKLKRVIEESKEDVADFEIKETDWPESNYVGKKETVEMERLGEFFGKYFPEIGQELGKNKIEPEAAPSAIYTIVDEKTGKTDVAAVFKVAKGVKVKGYETFNVPSGKALLIEYYGDYSKFGNAHRAMSDYMKKKDLVETSVIEEYVTDPMSEKDTAKWLTKIYYILK